MEKIKIYGTTWCGTSRRVVRTFDEYELDYDFIDIDQDPDSEKLVIETNKGNRSVPTIFYPDGTVMVEPRDRVLREKLDSLS
jgi:mycoredoxin